MIMNNEQFKQFLEQGDQYLYEYVVIENMSNAIQIYYVFGTFCEMQDWIAEQQEQYGEDVVNYYTIKELSSFE